MALVSIAELRDHLDTPKSDGALRLLIQSAQAAVERYAGSALQRVETAIANRVGSILFLANEARSITEIRVDGAVLPATAYALQPDRRTILRTDAYGWYGNIVITYVPDVSVEQYKEAIIGLVMLEAARTGFRSEGLGGGVTYQQEDYAAARAAIFAKLSPADTLGFS